MTRAARRHDRSVTLRWPTFLSTLVLVAACGGDGDGPKPPGDGAAVSATPATGSSWSLSSRLRANQPVSGYGFGAAVRLSADGGTLAVSAPDDEATATTIDGSETERSGASLSGSGSVHVYLRAADGRWSRQAYLKAPEIGGRLGTALAISPDGNRLIVGASQGRGERIEFPTALGGTELGFGAGRLYQFERDASGGWRLGQSLAIADGRQSDRLGTAVAAADDLQWVVAGAPGRDYGDVATAADFQNPLSASGAAYLFRRNGAGLLEPVRRLRAPVPARDAGFGTAVAMSGDGNWFAVGAPEDATDAALRAVPDPVAANTHRSGALYVYRREADGSAVLFAALKAPVLRNFLRFGRSIAFSADASLMAVGADLSGYDAESNPVSASGSFESGFVYVYRRSDTGFVLEASLAGPRAEPTDRFFGYSVDLSSDGRTLAVGMPLDGNAVGSANPGYVTWSGSVRLYERGATGWQATSTQRAVPPNAKTRLGKQVALSRDGRWLAAGAPDDETPGAGVDPAPTGQPIPGGGVYLFRR
ncbi:MAG: hypothetical protein AB7P21_19185 [Lautropia sp.]